ncbi:MAG: hypothetical protein QOK82_08675 [Nitrososphaeraceae archaeon]|nr:hypothetical protein [Nitrososphaeraceae archaeon]MDW0156451.1 hypothetical protein [Nitrososphaeraceae archaeon]
MTKELAKIYYQNREVKHIDISFDDACHRIDIGSAIHISGKDEIVTMDYDLTDPDNKEKELSLDYWEIKDYLDKVKVNHDSEGIMIEWLSPKGDIKSSLFIPMVRILHITVDNPNYKDIDKTKGIIEK